MDYSNIANNQINKIKTKDTIFIVCAGSILLNNFNKKSDIDFFIITEKTSKTKIYKNKNGIKIECFYYSKERMDNCIKNSDHILVDVLANGRIIYAKDLKYAETITKKMRKLFNNYKINKETLIKFQYRFEMIKNKILSTNDEDKIIRWLFAYSLPYIIRILFYINNAVPITLKKWPINVKKLKNLPNNFNFKLNILLGNIPTDEATMKKILLDIVNFINDNLGPSIDHYEIIQNDKDLTTLI